MKHSLFHIQSFRGLNNTRTHRNGQCAKYGSKSVPSSKFCFIFRVMCFCIGMSFSRGIMTLFLFASFPYLLLLLLNIQKQAQRGSNLHSESIDPGRGRCGGAHKGFGPISHYNSTHTFKIFLDSKKAIRVSLSLVFEIK